MELLLLFAAQAPLATTMEGFIQVATNVAAVCGALVALVAVYRLSVVNRSIRWFFRRLLSEPLGGWAQKQVGVVVHAQVDDARDQLKESTAWLSEGQERIGGEVMKLREDWQAGHTKHGERLDLIDARTLQLEPNGGKSIYDRITNIELAQVTAAALGDRLELEGARVATDLSDAHDRADRTTGVPGAQADAAARSAHPDLPRALPPWIPDNP